MSADGNAGAAAPVQGSSILTANIPPPPPAAPQAAPGSAAEAVQGVVDGPPEWAPSKFWDGERKSIKVEDLGRGYQNLEKLLGREKVPVPTSDEDEEGWQRWYAASGRPEAPDKYEFKRPDKLPDGLDYDEDTETEFRQWAHINGLNKKQANNLYEGYVKRQIERQSAYSTHIKQARATVESDMRREFGAQYEGKVKLAQSALSKYADPEYLRYLDESGRGNDPREIRAWIRVGEELSGSTKLKGTPAAEAAPEDLDRAISDFRLKHKDGLHQKDHPDHDRLVREYNKLFEMRFPEPGIR